MPPAITFRSTPARAYAVVSWVVAGIVLVAFAAQGGLAEVMAYGALPALLAVAGWVAFWRPELRVQRDGVQVVNLLSTTWLPWSAITGTKTRWGLELTTVHGKVGVWALPARSSLGRWTATRRPAPPLPHLGSVEGPTPGRGDPVTAAELIEEHRTGVSGTGPSTGAAPERRIELLPAGLLLVSAALALVTLLS